MDCEPLTGPNTTFWKLSKNGSKVGKITSAVYSPRLKKNVGLSMILKDHWNIGNQVIVETPADTITVKVM